MPVRGRWSTALVLGGVAATAASGLIFEIALTRVFAITQFYHFAFLTVSMALLGLGASGSALAAFPRIGTGGPRRWSWLATLQGLAIVGAYLVANTLPFDSFAIAWDRAQLGYLAIYYLILAVPFFFGGLIVAMLLMEAGQPGGVPSHLVYGASLVGSGLGCVVAILSLDLLGAEGAVVLAAAVAMVAAPGFAALHAPGLRTATLAGLAAALLLMSVWVPAPLAMNLSPYKGLETALQFPGAEITASSWDRGTRLDLVSSEGIRSLPGLSFTYTGRPPIQDGVTLDGDDLSPIPQLGPDEAAYASHLLVALPWQLRPGAKTLVLEPRGGLDLLVGLAGGATSIVAVEPHGAIVDLAHEAGSPMVRDPLIEWVITEPRTFVERTDEIFDVVDLALTAPYRPVTSGAYSLAEDYSLTVEAFSAYLERLEPGGIFAVMRWVQTPPSEETRLVATAAAAVRGRGGQPASAVVVLRNYSNVLLLVQPDGWSLADLEAVIEFAARERFDIIARPGLRDGETNRFSIVPDEEYSVLAAALLMAAEPTEVYQQSKFDVAPPTDDHPFFGHYFRWSQAGEVLDLLGRTWQPFGGAGYLVLVAFLLLAALSAVVLIVAPLAIRRRRGALSAPSSLRWWVFGYFGLLGLAFLLVEIPLVQLYILLIGDATTAFALVLFAVLLASGVGSMLSPRLPWRLTATALTVVAVASPLLVRWMTQLLLPAPLIVRALVGAAAIAPLGVLMGTMFPHGVSYLERGAPHLVPWAWGINGTASVISAVLAALLALAFGFSAVLLIGAAGYALAAVLAALAGPSLLGSGKRHEHDTA